MHANLYFVSKKKKKKKNHARARSYLRANIATVLKLYKRYTSRSYTYSHKINLAPHHITQPRLISSSLLAASHPITVSILEPCKFLSNVSAYFPRPQ